MRSIVVVGEKYGRWTVLEDLGSKAEQLIVRAQCDCGHVAELRFAHLRSGKSTQCRSCARTQHGCAPRGAVTPEHDAWVSMRQRCNNPKNPRYKDYGARGIGVCAEWDSSFEAFLRDVGKRPTPEHSLDRISNNEGYMPNNCRWATRSEQQVNSRKRRYSPDLVREILSSPESGSQLSKRLGISRTAVNAYRRAAHKAKGTVPA